MNKKELDYLGFDYSQRCKGIKIAVIDFTTSKYLKELKNVIQPFRMSYSLYEEKEFSHGFMVCSLISTHLPEATIYLLGPNERSIEFCIENNIEFVNFSGAKLVTSDSLERELSIQAILFTSAGNKYGEKETPTALNNDWIAVSSVHLINDKITLPSYNSYGAGAIDTMSFSNIRFHPVLGGKVQGTSFASPMAMILNAQYKANFKEKYNMDLSADQLRRVIVEHSEDILEDGKDLKSGYGIYKLKECDLNLIDSRDIKKLHWKVKDLAEQLIKNCKEKGIDIIITSTVRDDEYQEKLYQQGRTTPGRIVTNVRKPTFHSEKVGLAFDVVPIIDGKAIWNNDELWSVIGLEGVKLGLTWGGNWKSFVDKPHFQLDEDLKSSDILAGIRPSWFNDSRGDKLEISEWAIDGHKFVTDNSISDGTRPKDTITREEAWVMLERLHKLGGKHE